MLKKILVIDTGKEWGGGTNSLLELLKRFDKNKYHFTAMFYNNYKRGSESDIKTEIEKLGIDFVLSENSKQSIWAKILKEFGRLLFFHSNKFKKRYLFFIERNVRILPNAKRIIEVIDRLKIDLLYMNNQPSSNLEGIIASRIANIPCIQHSRIEAELNKYEIIAVNDSLSKMICVSQGVKQMFVAQGVDSSKCTVVYNGIDPSVKPKIEVSEIRKMWGVGEDEILICTVGSLIKRKRINDLIDALAQLQRHDVYRQNHGLPLSYKCLIVGDGPEKDNLQKEVVKKGLQDKVILTGFQTDVVSIINAVDIFVLPSEREGLPRVILEAMLMARPVVACDVTGPSELVADGETGFLVSVKETNMLANALLKLAASDDLRRQMGEKGRMRVIERFTIDKYVNGVSNIFEEVLA